VIAIYTEFSHWNTICHNISIRSHSGDKENGELLQSVRGMKMAKLL